MEFFHKSTYLLRCVHGHTCAHHVPWHICGHQRTTYDNCLSLSVMAVLGIRLQWSGLGASASPSQATSAAPWV